MLALTHPAPYCLADLGIAQQSSGFSDDSAAAAAGSAAADGTVMPTAAAGAGPSVSLNSTTATSVELSVLRAELAASDAEVDHVLSHLSLLQRQVSSAAAGSHAQTAAAPADTAAEVLVSELEFLRNVSRYKPYSLAYPAIEQLGMSQCTIQTSPTSVSCMPCKGAFTGIQCSTCMRAHVCNQAEAMGQLCSRALAPRVLWWHQSPFCHPRHACHIW